MKIKPVFAIILVYLVIFGVFFVIYYSKNGENSQSEENIFKIVGGAFKGAFDDIKGMFKSIKKPKFLTSVKNPLFSKCKFEGGFDCIDYFPDKLGGTVLLNVESLFGIEVMVYGAEVSGDITCTSSNEIAVRPREKFYIKLENCSFNGTSGDIKVRYYKIDSSKEFGKSVAGVLVLVD